MADNMDNNMADNMLQLSQSQGTLISRRPITGLPTARPITEHLNFAITGSGEWSAEILLNNDENFTLPNCRHSMRRRRKNTVIRQDGWLFWPQIPQEAEPLLILWLANVSIYCIYVCICL